MSPNSTDPLLYWNTPSFQNLLIWQQPHPIWMTEVERLNSPNATAAQVWRHGICFNLNVNLPVLSRQARAHNTNIHCTNWFSLQEVETRMGRVVDATADFMASFAVPPPAGSSCLPGCSDELWLGPPLERQSASTQRSALHVSTGSTSILTDWLWCVPGRSVDCEPFV